MKTKLSKKLLSAFLAVLMIVTSLPIVSISAFALDDAAVKEVTDAMTVFEKKLESEGQFTNVTTAYNAYVDCQKALDAYIYGGKDVSVLSGKASALTTATNNIGAFTGKKGTAVPSFTADSGTMSDYAGAAYNNILYTSTVTASNEMQSSATGNTVHRIFYPETTLLYDGTNDTIMPVMGMASVNAKKTRYIYASYPCVSTTDNTDNQFFNLTGYWHGNSGESLDFTWSWYYTNDNPGYNYATGYLGNQDTSHRSQQLTYTTNWIGSFSSGATKYIANAMKFVGTPASTYSDYSLIWYVSSGESANSDVATIDASASTIHVVNYKTLTDALATNGNKMKTISVADFSEGGLSAYVTAMDAATSFDPNTYFTSSNDYIGCSNQIATLASNINNASVTNTDSADYAALRAAMSDNVRAIYAGGNTGYTVESWSTFSEKYAVAKTIMSACNESGYISTSAATAAAELTAAFEALETEVTKVDASSLVSAIDAFYAMDSKYFTAESYAAAEEIINAAKAAVWGSAENYNIPTEALDDSTEAQATVAAQVDQVAAATKLLRFTPDLVINISSGDKYSLNSAIALKDNIADPTDYSNYTTYRQQLVNADAYRTSLADTEFTDLDTQLAEYTAMVQATVDGYNALTYSFTRLPDGTIASTGANTSITTLSDSKNSSGYNWWIDFSYPSSGIVFKTTHDALTVNYGTAYVSYKINIDNNISKENNSLDSITINGTADANTQINSKNATSTPTALSDDEKATYAGCLAVDGFSLTNFRVSSTTNNAKSYYGVNADGTTISSKEAPNDEYTTILATTEGSSANPATGCIALQPSKSGDAQIVLAADMNVDIPATTAETLSSSTIPSSSTYTLKDRYFGATYVWNTQPTLAYAGYAYLTSKSNSEALTSTVTVVDISYLVDLVNLCNTIVPYEEMYTVNTWSNFATALENAQKDLNYNTMTALNITNQCVTRYNNLWAAYDALKVKTFNVVFNYKDATGADTSTTIVAEYGKSLNDYIDQFNAINPPTYIADNCTNTFNGNWDPQIDMSAAIKADAAYTAQYDSVLNSADFTAYNTAKASLIGALTDETYTITDLEDLANALSALTYFTYTDEQKSATMADVQSAIDAEAATIQSLLNGLTASSLTYDAARAAIEAAKTNAADIDRFDLSGLDLDDSDYRQGVYVCAEATNVIGLRFSSQSEVEEYTKNILNNMQVKTYTIYLNGASVATEVPYGTPVIIDSDGTAYLDVTDTDINNTSDTAVWKYSYNAPSREVEGKGATEPKYMTTAPSLGFIVKGDTYLTADIQDSASADTTYIVTVKASTGSIIDVATTTGSYTMPTAPNYAFYTFSGYANGANAGDVITVDKNTTIIANYTADASNTFTISTSASLNAALYGDVQTNAYAYNEKVTINPEFSVDYDYAGDETVYCWTIADFNEYNGDIAEASFTVISYNTSAYSFYACQAFELTDVELLTGKMILPLTYDEYEVYVMAGTAIEEVEGTVYINGTYTSPDVNFVENVDSTEKVLDLQGNVILANEATYKSKKWTLTGIPGAQPNVTALSDVVPIYNGDSVEKFSIIGTFTLPEGYSIVECGFLFTSDTAVDDGSMVLEAVGSNGIARMKSSLYTCGNQFVVNVKNPSSSVAFKYVAYAIIKDADGNLIECYATPYQSSNNF